MRAFVLPIEDIDDDGKQWRFPIEASWLTEAFAGTGLRPTQGHVPGVVEVFAQRSGDDILLRGRVKTAFACDCARCLEDAVVDVDADLTTLLMPEAQRPAHGAATDAASDDDVVDPEDVGRDYYSGDEVVLDPLVRELIVLEEPMQPYCRPDCPGIPIPEGVKPPADFGREEADVDPRLAPLLKLKRALAQTEE